MNNYYTPQSDAQPDTKVRAVDYNNLDNAISAAFDKLPAEPALKQGTVSYAVDTGAINAYVVALANAPAALVDGLLVEFKTANANTAAATININGLGAVALCREDGSALAAGDVVAGFNHARYNSTTGMFHMTKRDTITKAEAQALISGGGTPANIPITSLGFGTMQPRQVLRLNAAGNALEGASSGIARRTISAASTIVATDDGNLIDITGGTFTLAFAACATLGSSFRCFIRNAGTGVVTLDPNGAETIDGMASYPMYPNEVRLVIGDGATLTSIVLQAYRFTSQVTGTWTRPPGYNMHAARLVPGGTGGTGGAGGGSGGSTTGNASGGGGGAGGSGGSSGAAVTAIFAASILPASVNYTIGAGGIGGTGGTGGSGANGTGGNPGTTGQPGAAGGQSTFGTTGNLYYMATGASPVSTATSASGQGGVGTSVIAGGAANSSNAPISSFSTTALAVSTYPTSNGTASAAGSNSLVASASFGASGAGGKGGDGTSSIFSASTAGAPATVGSSTVGAAGMNGTKPAKAGPGCGGAGGAGGAGSAGCGTTTAAASSKGGDGGAGGDGGDGMIELTGVI